MNKFEINIDLGNEAMETAEDVARALETVATRLRRQGDFFAGIIHDLNGNSVGEFGLT